MDRYLVAGAVLLLILEASLLFSGLDLDARNAWLSHSQKSENRESIGAVQSTENLVRRRTRSSLVWDESREKDSLYEFDSVLTLKDSTARLNLSGGTVINLDENTLVVLESPDGRAKQNEGSLRIRFSRGNLRSENPNEALAVETGSWTVDAEKGSQISLVGLGDNQFGIEVSGGAAKVHDAMGEHRIASGERVQVTRQGVGERKKVSPDLKWSRETLKRIYSPNFPVVTDLRWTGHAKLLRMIDPTKRTRTIDLSAAQTGASASPYPVELSQGSYIFYLENGDFTSEALTVQARRAPTLRYFTPLPRDRVRTTNELLFTWEAVGAAKSFVLELSPTTDFNANVERVRTQGTRALTVIQREGEMYWRVVGVDSDGFSIPAPRVYPLFSTSNPLHAPDLLAPELRKPASPDVDSHSNMQLIEPPPASGDQPAPQNLKAVPNTNEKGANLWLELLLPKSYAAGTVSDIEAVFTWKEVAGADHYVIEISQTPGFESPLVIGEVEKPEYVWRGFKKGTYFWRVAAGHKASPADSKEQLGLFSSPAVAKLHHSPTALANGVEIRTASITVEVPSPTPEPPQIALSTPEPAPAPQAALQPVPSATPLRHAKAKITPSPTPAPLASATPTPHATPQPTSRRAETKAENKSNPPIKRGRPQSEDSSSSDPSTEILHLRVWANPHWRMKQSKNNQRLEGEFRGFVPLSLEGEVSFGISSASALDLRVSFDQTSWEADATKAPFQNDLHETRFSGGIVYAPTVTPWHWGVAAEHISVFTRTANESGSLDTKDVFGPMVRYRTSRDANGFEGRLITGFGDAILAKGFLTWTAGVNLGFATLHIGPYSAASYTTKNDLSLSEFEIGIRAGFSLP